MNQLGFLTKMLDKKAGGNTGFLNTIFKTSLSTIKRSCKTEEEFDEKCKGFLDTVCAQMGEENREFYQNYIAEVISTLD